MEGLLTPQQLGVHDRVDKHVVDNNKYFTFPESMCLLKGLRGLLEPPYNSWLRYEQQRMKVATTWSQAFEFNTFVNARKRRSGTSLLIKQQLQLSYMKS